MTYESKAYLGGRVTLVTGPWQTKYLRVEPPLSEADVVVMPKGIATWDKSVCVNVVARFQPEIQEALTADGIIKQAFGGPLAGHASAEVAFHYRGTRTEEQRLKRREEAHAEAVAMDIAPLVARATKSLLDETSAQLEAAKRNFLRDSVRLFTESLSEDFFSSEADAPTWAGLQGRLASAEQIVEAALAVRNDALELLGKAKCRTVAEYIDRHGMNMLLVRYPDMCAMWPEGLKEAIEEVLASGKAY